jgi:hypothetical protein
MIGAVNGLLDNLLDAYSAIQAKGGVDKKGKLNEESIDELKEMVYQLVVDEYNVVFMKVPLERGSTVDCLNDCDFPVELLFISI